MTQQERKGWFIVVSLFFVLLLIFGSGYNTVGIFVPALLRGFPHWSRAEVSLLPSMLALSAGVSVIPIGWLLDRVEARIVMVLGALGSGGAFLIASQVNSLAPMMGAYLLLGVGLSAATVLPGTLVIANWFDARRGLAMGIAVSGTTVGGTVMTLVANAVIVRWGWRAAYLALGLPMIVVVIPLVLLMVRNRPPGAVKMTVAQSADLLEGFETSEAIRSRSFWMLAAANFCFGFAAAGAVVHMVSYLEGIGYKSGSAALAMSGFFAFAAIGKVTMGLVADRIGARRALTLDFAAGALALSMVFSAAHVGLLMVFVVVFGTAAAAPLMLLPLLTVESLGRKRYGFLGALTGMVGTMGAVIGPVVAGRIFDLTHSYVSAFELFIALYALGACAALACQAYGTRSSPIKIAAVPASA
ncbi:MAG TPA: MFS transporter [Candidatus Binataceae bacterium]|nr:MFS transporter [Candidatus Binataceae bacterium]